ncbi:hypothetical protein [Lachnoanaerobaculum umeaense]|uniref:Uncharacterized protein n=1 Tax=Lachnoanaerobaculum umeaense TaxID=617123 RepID=A0A385Q2N7_9FIRM|nr:hypothetical protein [Lachnoanaerobaculum umeaense]AYA99884.1 hypothetical protein D4A81_08015 [Lachnoanaerobaculum umeaense]PZW98343.1 hypothetical protein C7439_10671 [Lachnoanaerobaculum umeaense]
MKKNLKKLIVAAMSASLLMACGSNVKSEETKEDVQESVVQDSVEADKAGMSVDMNSNMPLLPGAENGNVKSITDDTIRIERISYLTNEVESSEESKEGDEVADEVDLLLDASAIKFVDITTGLVSDAPKEGDEIYAWVAPEYMTSMPPQVNSYVVLTNVTDDLHMPMYTDSIEGIEESDGRIELMDTLNNAKWSVDKNVKPILSSTGEEVEFSDIKKGDKVLVWSENFMLTVGSKDTPKIQTNRVVILK